MLPSICGLFRRHCPCNFRHTVIAVHIPSKLREDFDMIDIDVDRKKLIRVGAVNYILDFNFINGENVVGIDKIADIQIFPDFFKAGCLGQVGFPRDIKKPFFQISGIQAAAAHQKGGCEKNQMNEPTHVLSL